MSIRFLTKKESGSSSPKLNIFTGENEPETKKGLWLQTNKTFENIIFKDNYILDENWEILSKSGNNIYGSSVYINDYIFIFYENGNAYKYNINTKIFSQITSVPTTIDSGSPSRVITHNNTDIYISGLSKNFYKYNIATDTYTKLAEPSTSLTNSGGVLIGDNIYVFGGYQVVTTAKKYNITNNSWSNLPSIPFQSINTSVVSVGTDIYLFGGNANYTVCYKYDTVNNIYQSMLNIPYSYNQGSAVSVGTDIYLFGGKNGNTMAYKFNTITNTYKQLPNIPLSHSYINAGVYIPEKEMIYLTGNSSNFILLGIHELELEENSIIISQMTGFYLSEIIKNELNIKTFLYNCWFYDKDTGIDDTIPSYYGNGIEWIKFKN